MALQILPGGIHSNRYLWAMACKVCILSVRISVFWMPQILFAFEFVCERPNDLCQIDIRLFRKFHFIFIENGWIAIWLDILKYKIFECEWMNGNSNDLCMTKWQFGCSHSNSNANGKWGIQNAIRIMYALGQRSFPKYEQMLGLYPYTLLWVIREQEPAKKAPKCE